MIDFELGPIRPPSEADSLLIRLVRGCSWNRCAFCTLYKGVPFSIRPVEDIKKDILAARDFHKGRTFENCFLQDGDSFAMPTDDLVEVLNALKEAFPSLKQISSYGRAQSMAKKTPEEMRRICEAGLNMLYSGMESGSLAVLKKVKKGITPDTFVRSSLMAQEAGMDMMVFMILGLGGKELSKVHIEESARVLNQINPKEIRVLSLAVKQETDLGKMAADGSFTLLSEVEMIEEQKELFQLLEVQGSRYGNYHCINLLMELNGTLPDDKEHFLSVVNDFLSLKPEDQNNFILGRRIWQYHKLEDLKNRSVYEKVRKEIARIGSSDPAVLENVFHDFRRRMI